MGRYCALFVLVAAALGCATDSTGSGDCISKIVANDLVITEIYGNSPGGDEGNEWFEIYNASSKSLNLGGVTLVKTDGEGDGRREHLMREAVIEPGQYFVVGGILEEFQWDYIDYGYGPDLGTLGNSAGRLYLQCGTTVIDRVDYVDLAEGKSHQLTGLVSPPNAEANDDFAGNFCTGREVAFFQGEIGTPQQANEICPPLTQEECIADGSLRAVNKATAGDIEISEFMANPSAVADAEGEWIELRVLADIDLNGIQLGRAEADTGAGDVEQVIAAVECLPASAGDYPVLVRSTDPSVNGGITSPYSLDFGLVNSDDGVYVGIAGTPLDTVLYATSKGGVATQIDLEGDPCDATMPYGDGDLGTPGIANGECEAVVTVPDGMCIDTANGDTIRAIDPFGAAELRIIEWMPNPDAVVDTDGEWFELEVLTTGDLNGLQVGHVGDPEPFVQDGTVRSNECLRFTAGDYAVIGRNGDPVQNGGLPVGTVEVSGFSLTNTSDSISVAVDSVVIDSVSYTSSTTAAATQIAQDDAICAATETYGDGDRGTPGASNDATCP